MRSHENTECRSIVSSYPAAGFQDDAAKLLQRFVATKSIRFEEFLKVWKASNFTFIYLGRNGMREQREFVEEAFRVLLKYIMPPYNLQVRVGGIYTLYSIYNTQTSKYKAKIRIPLSCWPKFCDLEKEILEHKHLDAAYVIRKLNADRAILLCAYPSMLSVDEMYVMTGLSGSSVTDSATHGRKYEQTNPLAILIEDDTIGQLDAVHEKYHQLKCSYNGIRNGETDSPGSSLDLIKADMARSIINIVNPPKPSSSRYSISSTANTEHTDSDSRKRASKLKSIKQVALRSDIVEVRKLKKVKGKAKGRGRPVSSNKTRERALRGEVAESGLVFRKRGRPTATAPKIRLSDIPSESEDLSDVEPPNRDKQLDNPSVKKKLLGSTPENLSDRTNHMAQLSAEMPIPDNMAKGADTMNNDVTSGAKTNKKYLPPPWKSAKWEKDSDFVPNRLSFPSQSSRKQPPRSSRLKSIDLED